jgi:ADP-ribosyl-[dinitrogen reductase] hydrolase
MLWNEAQFFDRAIGGFIGAAVGDALGAPLEFGPAHKQDTPREMTGGGGFRWAPGETTDDTAMGVAVSKMYLGTKGYSQEYLVHHFLEWYKSGPKDVGAWTSQSLRVWSHVSLHEQNAEMYGRGLRQDKHPIIQLWRQRGSNDAGNGGVMRCWPTALATPDKKDRLREARWICEDTHPDPRCVASCQAVVEAMHTLMRGGTTTAAWWNAMDAVGQEKVTHDALQNASSLPWEKWSNSGYTVGTLNSAFASMLQANSFEEGLTAIVNRGNDADTVGAVAGALLGSRFGYKAIPDRWKLKLQKHDELLGMAHDLLGVRRERRRVR